MNIISKLSPILIAEDDPEDRYLAQEAINQLYLDIDIRFVNDGEELMDYLMSRGEYGKAENSPRPKLILMDLNMPRMDGREALKVIKSSPELKPIPVIILTTSRAQDDVDRAYELGANSFITKPTSFEGLVKAMIALKLYWSDTVELPES